jgi:V8-like Glu-specific endopeptidase
MRPCRFGISRLGKPGASRAGKHGIRRAGQPGAGRPARGTRRSVTCLTWGVSLVTVAAISILVTTPTAHGAVRMADRLAAAVRTLSRHAPDAPETLASSRSYGGTRAVGALFTVSSGQLGKHFCTASVVDSPVRDLVITAAHCVSGMTPGQIAFVPGYHNGLTPYGIWDTTQVITDSAWRTSASPDDDVAFLVVVSQSGSSEQIQDVTGGEQLGTGWPARALVHVIGYPDTTSRPVTCQGWTKPFGAREMKFDCDGFTGGTSGGPFLGKVSATTGRGTVIGVIGGYEQGGYIASVSYSPRFGSAIEALYQNAIRDG